MHLLIAWLIEGATAQGRAFRSLGIAAVATDHTGNANIIVADVIEPACQQGAPLSILPAGVGRTVWPAQAIKAVEVAINTAADPQEFIML